MLKQYYYSPSSSSPSMNSVMSSPSASWEEKAFAEDAAGALGGGSCIWPPRSYSCSFCMREFRSAQALGGHMNVHRRDRARLKQCLHNTSSTATPALVTDHVPHHLRNHSHGFAATYPFSAPRAFTSPYSSSSNSCSTAAAAAASWSDSKAADLLEKNIMVMGSSEEEDQSIINLLGGDQVGDYVETDLSVGLINTVVRGTRQLAGSCGEASTCKRPKIASAMNSSAPFSFFLQSAEVNGLMAAANSMEDLDLELRLGDPTPKMEFMKSIPFRG